MKTALSGLLKGLTKQSDLVISIPATCDIAKLANEAAKSFGRGNYLYLLIRF